MRLNVLIEVNCGSGLLVTVKKNVMTTCETVMEVVQTALRGDMDTAHIIGSISQHLSRLPELNTNFSPGRDIRVYVNLPEQVISIKYSPHDAYDANRWRICTTEFPRFLALEENYIWRFIEHMSCTFNIQGTTSGRTS